MREITAFPHKRAGVAASTPIGPVVAEGRVLDAVTGHELRGTLDDLADSLGITYDDLRVAIDELAAIGWVTVELSLDGYVRLILPADLRFAS